MALIIISSCSFGQKSKKVAYTLAQNYFVKNTVRDGVFVFPKITSQKDFDKLFGMAPIAGKNGQPTAIDFSKQYVIAVVDDLSYTYEGLDPVSLTKMENQLTFTFSKTDVSEGSAKFRRCLVIIVDNSNEGEVIIKDNNGNEYIPYTLANRYFVKNTIDNKEHLLQNITTEDQFNHYFGMATVMGEDGQPTPIDFTKQFVIAVISESSEDEVNYAFNVTKKGNTTSVNYRTEGGKPGDTYRYCAILIVDKKYENKIEIQKK